MSIEALLLTLLGSIRRPGAFCARDCSTGGRAMSFQEQGGYYYGCWNELRKPERSLLDLVPCGLVVSKTNFCLVPLSLEEDRRRNFLSP
jgi:hypothetical protein